MEGFRPVILPIAGSWLEMVFSSDSKNGTADTATPQQPQPCGKVSHVFGDEHCSCPERRHEDQDVGNVTPRIQEPVPPSIQIQELSGQRPLLVPRRHYVAAGGEGLIQPIQQPFVGG